MRQGLLSILFICHHFEAHHPLSVKKNVQIVQRIFRYDILKFIYVPVLLVAYVLLLFYGRRVKSANPFSFGNFIPDPNVRIAKEIGVDLQVFEIPGIIYFETDGVALLCRNDAGSRCQKPDVLDFARSIIRICSKAVFCIVRQQHPFFVLRIMVSCKIGGRCQPVVTIAGATFTEPAAGKRRRALVNGIGAEFSGQRLEKSTNSVQNRMPYKSRNVKNISHQVSNRMTAVSAGAYRRHCAAVPCELVFRKLHYGKATPCHQCAPAQHCIH